MRGHIDSKSKTCTERLEVDAAGISVKVKVVHEPPWYGTVRPVVWEVGGGNPSFYPI